MTTIGRFEIERELGRGAMGTVYLAFDPRVRRRIAVKTFRLPDGVSPEVSAEFRTRFLREAQAAGALSHPGIVTIYDADADPAEGDPYIAMEYVPGRSLKDVLADDAPLPVDRACDLVDQVAAALEAAHRAGVVHRDIKPANVLLHEEDGLARLADFGIARLPTSDLTRTGGTLGSPAYMSPEQVRGATLDARSDLFSLAVVLYEALTGLRPFGGEDLAALAYSVAHETPVRPSRRVAGVPTGLDRFLERALAKTPESRYRDATEFRDALKSARTDTAEPPGESTVVTSGAGAAWAAPAEDIDPPLSSAPPSPWPGGPAHDTATSRRGLVRFLLAGAALVLVSFGGWQLLGSGETATVHVECRSSVADGELEILVDGDRVFRRRLQATPQKNGTKRLVTQVLKWQDDRFNASFKIRPGEHTVVARVTKAGEEDVQEDRVVLTVEAGDERSLKLVAGRVFGSPISLTKG